MKKTILFFLLTTTICTAQKKDTVIAIPKAGTIIVPLKNFAKLQQNFSDIQFQLLRMKEMELYQVADASIKEMETIYQQQVKLIDSLKLTIYKNKVTDSLKKNKSTDSLKK